MFYLRSTRLHVYSPVGVWGCGFCLCSANGWRPRVPRVLSPGQTCGADLPVTALQLSIFARIEVRASLPGTLSGFGASRGGLAHRGPGGVVLRRTPHRGRRDAGKDQISRSKRSAFPSAWPSINDGKPLFTTVISLCRQKSNIREEFDVARSSICSTRI